MKPLLIMLSSLVYFGWGILRIQIHAPAQNVVDGAIHLFAGETVTLKITLSDDALAEDEVGVVLLSINDPDELEDQVDLQVYNEPGGYDLVLGAPFNNEVLVVYYLRLFEVIENEEPVQQVRIPLHVINSELFKLQTSLGILLNY